MELGKQWQNSGAGKMKNTAEDYLVMAITFLATVSIAGGIVAAALLQGSEIQSRRRKAVVNMVVSVIAPDSKKEKANESIRIIRR